MKAVLAVLLVGLVAAASAILGGPDCPGCPPLTQQPQTQQVPTQQQGQVQQQTQVQQQAQAAGGRLTVFTSPLYSTGVIPSLYSARVVPAVAGYYPYYARV